MYVNSISFIYVLLTMMMMLMMEPTFNRGDSNGILYSYAERVIYKSSFNHNTNETEGRELTEKNVWVNNKCRYFFFAKSDSIESPYTVVCECVVGVV